MKSNKISLISYWSIEAVKSLIENEILRADGGERIFTEFEKDEPENSSYRICYDFVANHTPGCGKGVYPLWAWMYKNEFSEEDPDLIRVEYIKRKEECLCTSFSRYSDYFGYSPNISENIIVSDWRRRLDTQVTFFELRLEEVTNIKEVKEKLASL